MDMTAALACPLLHTATVMLEQRCVFTPTSESTAFHDSGDTMAPWPLAAAIRAAANTRAEAELQLLFNPVTELASFKETFHSTYECDRQYHSVF